MDKRERGNKWLEEEDQQLVRAYLEIATDDAVGNSQDARRLWVRIFDELKRHGNTNGRTAQKIETRFTKINRCISKFSASMMMIERNPNSGEVEEDKVIALLNTIFVLI